MAGSRAYLAHSRSVSGRDDPISSHLLDVAKRAAEYARAYGASDEAVVAGLLHDLGKYGAKFEERLAGRAAGVDHWSLGAWAAIQHYQEHGIGAALAVQGHHTGLQQASNAALGGLDPQRLASRHPDGLHLSAPDLRTILARLRADGLELPRSLGDSLYRWSDDPSAADMLDVRMLFSALVDADYIETEAHFNAGPDRAKCYRAPGPLLEAESALSVLLSYLKALRERSAASAAVTTLRADLLRACLEAAGHPCGLFTLTAPTGSGKTLSMLAFALKHAVTHGLRRIVTVIPYLTIIEQTVREYRKALAELRAAGRLQRYVLEDHSLAGTRGDGRVSPGERAENADSAQERLLAENWDAPIVVTTSVQFLESLFSNRPSACRKLHRLANSVVLFDEVQTLPMQQLIPTLATLSHLSDRYGATVVFATATQPAFEHLHDKVKEQCAAGWRPREIVPADLRLFQRARRTQVIWPRSSHTAISWTELAAQLADRKQALCVLNLKRHALHLFEELQGKRAGHVYHLSTNMCPAHRQDVLREARERLAAGRPCCLVSTQCVEAGVDVDFPVVFRAWGPLDAIAQAAGRCNREGRGAVGNVHVFIPEDAGRLYPDPAYQQAASVAEIILRKHGAAQMDLDAPSVFEEYYRELYDFARPENQSPELAKAIRTQHFAEVARLYRVIKKDAINVLVPYDLATFHGLADEVRQTGLTSGWIHKARPHTVGLFRPRGDDRIRDYLEPIRVGRKGECSDQWFIYLAEDHYDAQVGLRHPQTMPCWIA